MFGKYGTILSCKVVEENGTSKGFGFVQFDSEDMATAALNALNGTMLEGKQICVCNFVRKNERKDALNETFTNLYFKNFDEDVPEDFPLSTTKLISALISRPLISSSPLWK